MNQKIVIHRNPRQKNAMFNHFLLSPKYREEFDILVNSLGGNDVVCMSYYIQCSCFLVKRQKRKEKPEGRNVTQSLPEMKFHLHPDCNPKIQKNSSTLPIKLYRRFFS